MQYELSNFYTDSKRGVLRVKSPYGNSTNWRQGAKLVSVKVWPRHRRLFDILSCFHWRNKWVKRIFHFIVVGVDAIVCNFRDRSANGRRTERQFNLL